MSETEDYAGAAVTWDNVTGKPTEFAPEAHKTGHQDGGADEIDATSLAGRVNYVDRGDPAAVDWAISSLTADGTWHELDCSAIVPSGARAIHIQVTLYTNTASKTISIRKNGNVNATNILYGITVAANMPCPIDGVIVCDDNRKLQYSLSAATWLYTGITIRGWLI